MSISRWQFGILLALLVVISGAYLSVALGTEDGRPVAPLDDAYITYQYARQIAQGQPYRYNDGDPATTGMTSPLFGFLLAGAYRVGCAGERLVTLALGLGVVWLALIGWLTYRVGVHLTESRGWALLGTALALLTGSIQWGCFNGMETGLFTVLTLAAVYAFLTQRHPLSALWLGLAGLMRTEGLILAGLIWASAFVDGVVNRRHDRWHRLAILSAALPVGLLPSLTNWWFTGDPSAAGLQAKSWFLNVPFYPEDVVRSILHEYRRIILGRFLAGREWFLAPGALLLSLLGWLALGVRRRWVELSVTLSWLAVGTLSTATLITATWHMGRYQVPFAPVAIALAVCGIAFLWQAADENWQRILTGALACYLLVASAYAGLHYLRQYRKSVLTMAHQQLRIADWLREHLPADAHVGVHDTGSLRYVGKRPTYDLVGLTTPNAAEPWRHGAGSVFEQMEHSPMRPDHFTIYPDVFSIPYLAATDLFAEELFRVRVDDYGVASAGPVQGVWRADWRLAASGDAMHQPDVLRRTRALDLVDALDVADLVDEEAHRVAWWQDAKRPGFPTEVWQLTYQVPPHPEVLDGGRLLNGGLAFDASTQPGRDLWIVARLHAQAGGGVRVEIDGQGAGHWAYPPVPGRWLETAFRVPGERITRSQTRVTLRVAAENPSFRHYALYYVWLLQGDAGGTTCHIEHRLDAAFAQSLSLVGYDLPARTRPAGDALPVVLYWRAQGATRSGAKVFLHLYDGAGDLVAQSDGWAFHGTRPPYAWRPGEIVADPRTLVLPEGLAPGAYSLEVGLYAADGSGRLPAFHDGARQPEDRVLLTGIEVEE